MRAKCHVRMDFGGASIADSKRTFAAILLLKGKHALALPNN